LGPNELQHLAGLRPSLWLQRGPGAIDSISPGRLEQDTPLTEIGRHLPPAESEPIAVFKTAFLDYVSQAAGEKETGARSQSSSIFICTASLSAVKGNHSYDSNSLDRLGCSGCRGAPRRRLFMALPPPGWGRGLPPQLSKMPKAISLPGQASRPRGGMPPLPRALHLPCRPTEM